MSARSEKIKAGIFVLLSGTILTMILVLVVGFRISKRTKTYYVRFTESVTGLEPSSTVRYYGVPVGRVASIGFAQDEFPVIEVTIEVAPDTPIRTDTRAILKPQGITGLYYIDLLQGTATAERLEQYGTIAAEESVLIQLQDTLDGIRQVVENLNQLIMENREGITAAVQAIEDAADSARDPLVKLDEVLEGANEAIRDLHGRLGPAIDAADETLAGLAELVRSPEVRGLPGRVAGIADRAEAVLAQVEEQVSQADLGSLRKELAETLTSLKESGSVVAGAVGDTRGSLIRILADMKSFSTTLKHLAREVREDPSRLLLGGVPREREEGR